MKIKISVLKSYFFFHYNYKINKSDMFLFSAKRKYQDTILMCTEMSPHFFATFTNGDNFCDIQFPSLDEEDLPKWSLS